MVKMMSGLRLGEAGVLGEDGYCRGSDSGSGSGSVRVRDKGQG
jgi:hypothetical protein